MWVNSRIGHGQTDILNPRFVSQRIYPLNQVLLKNRFNNIYISLD